MCSSFVVTGGIRCMTGGIPVGLMSLSKRFTGIIKGLIGVIGRFGA
jgi:hypothetical protein